jgi:hypothetical protein
MSDESWMFEIPPSIVQHPDFVKGVPIGRECYFQGDCNRTFTLAEVLARIKRWLSRKLYANAMRYERIHKLEHLSYAYDVGGIVGWLHTLLLALPPLDAIFLIFALAARAQGRKVLRCLEEISPLF